MLAQIVSCAVPEKQTFANIIAHSAHAGTSGIADLGVNWWSGQAIADGSSRLFGERANKRLQPTESNPLLLQPQILPYSVVS